MIYSEQTTKKALRLCYAGQKNRLTEEGMPEIFEWFAIAESMQDESAVTTALLYGAVSSGCFDMNDIKELGFPEKVIHALQILCLNETLSNDEYRERILTSPLAWKVKYAELLHKGTPGRLIQTEENSKKLEQFWNERFALEKPFSVPYCLYSDEVRAQEKVIKNRRFRDAIRGCMIGSAVGDAYGYGISKENVTV